MSVFLPNNGHGLAILKKQLILIWKVLISENGNRMIQWNRQKFGITGINNHTRQKFFQKFHENVEKYKFTLIFKIKFGITWVIIGRMTKNKIKIKFHENINLHLSRKRQETILNLMGYNLVGWPKFQISPKFHQNKISNFTQILMEMIMR